MKEINIITNKMNHLIDPHLAIWGWEVPVYLFLGGLTAGILLIAALSIIFDKEKDFPYASAKLALWGPIALSLGMLALFLDIEFKLHVFRFYTAFEVTSPMSWGSWILLLVYPLNILLILAVLRKSWPEFFIVMRDKVGNRFSWPWKYFIQLVDFSEKNIKTVANLTVPVAIALGIYTGILLSSYGARPFWNASILGPIFLVSGLSTALAMNILLTSSKNEAKVFSRYDLMVVFVELVLIGLFLITLASGPQIKQDALKLIMGGELTHVFWIFVVGMGLLLPLILELVELKGGHVTKYFAPVLVLFGGLLFRFVMVEAGQLIGFINY